MTQEQINQAINEQFAIVGRAALTIEECEAAVKRCRTKIQELQSIQPEEKKEESKPEA